MKRGRVDIIWELPNGSWRWEASRYEGNGIFYGKVISPIVGPDGEYGTWYYNEIISAGARLVRGNQAEIDEAMNSPKTKKTREFQKNFMDTLDDMDKGVPGLPEIF